VIQSFFTIVSRSFCYSDSIIFRFYHPFFRFHRALYWLSHFCYSELVIFGFCQLFLRFRPYAAVAQPFWNSDLVILRFHQLLFVISSSIFKISSAIFLWFHQLFLRFRRALQWLNYFCYSESAIFWFCYTALQRLNYFIIFILEIWSTIFLNSSNILKISFSHKYRQPYPRVHVQSWCSEFLDYKLAVLCDP
jgi:hypothetical protein